MKKISSKLEIVGNFINNLLHKQNLIIFIGKVGIKIIACYKHQAIDNIFVSYEKDDHFQICCTFLKNYKKRYNYLINAIRKEPDLDEIIVQCLSEILIKDDKKILTFNIDKMWGLGTPEDLEHYIKNNNKI